MKSLLKGNVKYNLTDNQLIVKRTDGVYMIFTNRDNSFFQSLLSSLKNATPNPELNIEYLNPTIELPLDLFHRILRSNEVVYEQLVGLRETNEGLYCFSNMTKNFQLNHHEYSTNNEVFIDPQLVCKITRKIRDRERVQAKLLLEKTRITLSCEFPWVSLVIIIPTVQAKGGWNVE